MAWTEWDWDPDLVAKVTPEVSEEWLARDAEGIAMKVKAKLAEES